MQSNNEVQAQKDIHHVNTKWDGGMHFESRVNEHIIHLDKLSAHGGDNKGPRPKQLILSAIGGCTGMEILSILNKMRLEIEGINIEVMAELTDGHPKTYKSVHIIYKIKSKSPDKKKIEKAIQLAEDKYCGVIAMVRHFAKVTSEIQLL